MAIDSISFGCNDDYGRSITRSWGAATPIAREIVTLPTEFEIDRQEFLIRHPEFAPLLQDAELGESFLDAVLEEARAEISEQYWNAAAAATMAYFLAAHKIVGRWGQLNDVAASAVRAAKGDSTPTANKGDGCSLSSTSYGRELIRLQCQDAREESCC